MSAAYKLVARRANHRCEYCHAPEDAFNLPLELDHIVPRTAATATDDPDNLALSCRSCNLFKSDSLSGIDHKTASATPLFNPRVDSWDVHFTVDAESATIVGLTPTGRVTVER